MGTGVWNWQGFRKVWPCLKLLREDSWWKSSQPIGFHCHSWDAQGQRSLMCESLMAYLQPRHEAAMISTSSYNIQNSCLWSHPTVISTPCMCHHGKVIRPLWFQAFCSFVKYFHGRSWDWTAWCTCSLRQSLAQSQGPRGVAVLWFFHSQLSFYSVIPKCLRM